MKISLIGRSNVGKSSVFNRIAGRRAAIVNDLLGVTRDRKELPVSVYGMQFCLIDTPGISKNAKDELSQNMNEQSFLAVQDSDLVCFVVDAIDQVTSDDMFVAEWLRKTYKIVGNRPTIVVANKCENLKESIPVEKLGFGEAVYISAEHNLNMQELYGIFKSYVGDSALTEDVDTLKIAIAGRPNVGKSTLINAAIGANRLLTGNAAGTTRDSIPVNFEFNGRKITIIDTAGQRKTAKVDQDLEAFSVSDAWRYINQAHVVIIVLDVNIPLEKQDLNIARKAADEGKIIIFALNKTDSISNSKSTVDEVRRRLEKEFAQIPQVSCVPISAIEKRNIGTLFVHACNLFEKWNTRISTGKLNRFLEMAIDNYHPPLVNGMPIRLKFMSQTNTKPPSFAIISNRGDHLPDSYKRYLLNRLREVFGLFGIPLRLFIRTRENPYSKRK